MPADMKSTVMRTWHEHYALLAINCMNLEGAHAAIRVAGKNRAPIILNLYQGHLAHFLAPVAAAVVRTFVGSASVPVALTPNHGRNPDCIRQAFRADSDGLMIDAFAFPLEENVRQTRTVVELAASAQLCMEGELDHLADAPCYDQVANAGLMTQPTSVEPFIAQTGTDLLAVSIGTAHGMYAPGAVPATDFQRPTEIPCCSSVPLALHGGSGISFDQLQLCTALGIAKIDVGVATFRRGKSALLRTLCHNISIELADALKAIELAFEEAITPYLQASGSIGKAWFIFCHGLYASAVTHWQDGLHAETEDLACQLRRKNYCDLPVNTALPLAHLIWRITISLAQS